MLTYLNMLQENQGPKGEDTNYKEQKSKKKVLP